jgi:hypothetical protein
VSDLKIANGAKRFKRLGRRKSFQMAGFRPDKLRRPRQDHLERAGRLMWIFGWRGDRKLNDFIVSY